MNDLAAGFRYFRGPDPLLDKVAAVSKSISAIDSEDDIAAWVRGPLRELIPHQCAIFAYGYAHSLGITLERRLCVDLPASYFDAISLPNGQLRSPVLEKWLQSTDSMLIDIESPEWSLMPRWRENFVGHGLRNGIADGYRDPDSGLFVFACLINLDDRSLWSHSRLFHNIGIAQVYSAWQRVIERGADRGLAPATPTPNTLSPAEREVVKWIKAGKTNEEIGLILGKSKWTVKNQVARVLAKSGLISRVQLAVMK